jgi:hypothetical protein
MRGICIPMTQVQHPREYLTSGAIQVQCNKGKGRSGTQQNHAFLLVGIGALLAKKALSATYNFARFHWVCFSGCCLTMRHALMIASALRLPSATSVSQLITESLMM